MILAALAVCCWALAGCGSEPDIPGQSLSGQTEADEGETEIVFGQATATMRGAWRLWAEQSSAIFGADDESRIIVTGVTGEL
ncbi:MAG: hypothetical protein IIC73_07225, partial [Armatimonadetes bacterium]|nr:hypothetical protein [Armatimonadota bacterium]